METIRRATIYASTDARVASELLSRVLGRALDGVASGPANRQALFDAGYLVESYRQANLIYKYDMLRGAEKSAWQLRETPKGLDGYSWIVSAMAMGPADPEMEFGASRVDRRRRPRRRTSARRWPARARARRWRRIWSRSATSQPGRRRGEAVRATPRSTGHGLRGRSAAVTRTRYLATGSCYRQLVRALLTTIVRGSHHIHADR